MEGVWEWLGWKSLGMGGWEWLGVEGSGWEWGGVGRGGSKWDGYGFGRVWDKDGRVVMVGVEDRGQ